MSTCKRDRLLLAIPCRDLAGAEGLRSVGAGGEVDANGVEIEDQPFAFVIEARVVYDLFRLCPRERRGADNRWSVSRQLRFIASEVKRVRWLDL